MLQFSTFPYSMLPSSINISAYTKIVFFIFFFYLRPSNVFSALTMWPAQCFEFDMPAVKMIQLFETKNILIHETIQRGRVVSSQFYHRTAIWNNIAWWPKIPSHFSKMNFIIAYSLPYLLHIIQHDYNNLKRL